MNHSDGTKQKFQVCEVCALIAKSETTPKENLIQSILDIDLPNSKRCSEHPTHCTQCSCLLQYLPEEVSRALGKNGGTPLPKRCESCRNSKKKVDSKPENIRPAEDSNEKITEAMSPTAGTIPSVDDVIRCTECKSSFHFNKYEIHRAMGKNGGTPLPKRCESCRGPKSRKRDVNRSASDDGASVEEDTQSVEDSEVFDKPVLCNQCTESFYYSKAEIHRARGKNGGTPLPKRCETCRNKPRKKVNRNGNQDDVMSETSEKEDAQHGDENEYADGVEHPVVCVQCSVKFRYTPQELHGSKGKNGGTPLPKRCENCRASGRYKKKVNRSLSDEVVEEVEEEEAAESVAESQTEEEPRVDYDQPIVCSMCPQLFYYSDLEIHRAQGKNGGTPLPKKCENCRGKQNRNKKPTNGQSSHGNHNNNINFASDAVVESLSEVFQRSASVSASVQENLTTNLVGKALLQTLGKPISAGSANKSQQNGSVGPFSSVSRNEATSTPSPSTVPTNASTPTAAAVPTAPMPALSPAPGAAAKIPPPPLVPAASAHPVPALHPLNTSAGVTAALPASPSLESPSSFRPNGQGRTVKAYNTAPPPPMPNAFPHMLQQYHQRSPQQYQQPVHPYVQPYPQHYQQPPQHYQHQQQPPLQQQPPPPLTYEQARDLELKQRRTKGEPISNPTNRRSILPIYCGGGKLCGAEILYRLDCAPGHCPGTPTHQCNWKAVRCVHCKHTWDQDTVTTNEDGTLKVSAELKEMFTKHYCLHCRAGVHGGISNQYGILMH